MTELAADARGRAWEAYFTTTARLSTAIEAALKAECSVSLPEYNVLLQVHRAGSEGIRPSALAREVVFSPSRLTHTIRRLVERGHVVRTSCQGDGRGGIVRLTDDGERAYRAAAEVQRAVIRRYALAGLSDEEIRVLNRVFTRIAGRLDED
ncbi:MarR family transcriptional regulator [Actinomyces sp. B33]|uniref:MarR family winged helix-turn-helix transcriptional regulator n=1 Tax=Actinomyces sp. B33 TaxID=2942131 RepID=UPI0023410B19|nr:MarR family transcriptional regulator [Actinomyces sp. B33]MDC4232382.1 MarR family transcriptional regulator [Actinomyces sp. B33]